MHGPLNIKHIHVTQILAFRDSIVAVCTLVICAIINR